MYSVGMFLRKKVRGLIKKEQGRITKDLPTRIQVEMVPRQPDVDYEDSVTTEQRVALEKESDARRHYGLRVTILVSKANKKAGKVGKILL